MSQAFACDGAPCVTARERMPKVLEPGVTRFHSNRSYGNGDATLDRKSKLLPRLETSKEIDAATGCWIWNGAKTKGGYGGLWVNGEVKYVHPPLSERACGVPRVHVDSGSLAPSLACSPNNRADDLWIVTRNQDPAWPHEVACSACKATQRFELGVRHGSVTEHVEAEAGNVSYALGERWNCKVGLSAFREAAEGRP